MMVLKSVARRSLMIGFAIAAAACSRQPAATSSPPAPRPLVHAQASWDDYAARFIEEYFKAQPFFAVQAGRHEFDGRMADLSADGIAREVERLKQMRTQAEAFKEASLTSRQRFQREYLLSVIDNNLFRSAPGRKRKGDGSQPGRPLRGCALLVKRLSLRAVHKSLQN